MCNTGNQPCKATSRTQPSLRMDVGVRFMAFPFVVSVHICVHICEQYVCICVHISVSHPPEIIYSCGFQSQQLATWERMKLAFHKVTSSFSDGIFKAMHMVGNY